MFEERYLFFVCVFRKCTKEERLARREANNRAARERQERIREKIRQNKGKGWREGKAFGGAGGGGRDTKQQ